MKKKKKENLPLFKELIFNNFNKLIWFDVFYKLFILTLIFLSSYAFLRFLSLVINIKNYLIFVSEYFIIILFFISFPILIFQNYLGKYLRRIDIKNIYESYMIVKKEKKSNSQYFISILEENASRYENKKLEVKKNWKIVLILLILFIVFFTIGSLFSFYQYGKIVYKVIPAEHKEVLTMQSIVEKILNQLDEDTEQYKVLSNLYNQYTSSFTKNGINQNEYLEKLNQILQQGISTNLNKDTKYNQGKSGTPGLTNNKGTGNKGQKGESKILSQKYEKEQNENEKLISEKKNQLVTNEQQVKQNFLEFLKTRLFHPDSEKGKGKPGYQAQEIKSGSTLSSDFSTMLQSLYSSSSEFSYSLSNQLTESEKIQIFNFLLLQFNLSSSNLSFDEELFYKLIILYLDLIKKENK